MTVNITRTVITVKNASPCTTTSHTRSEIQLILMSVNVSQVVARPHIYPVLDCCSSVQSVCVMATPPAVCMIQRKAMEFVTAWTTLWVTCARSALQISSGIPPTKQPTALVSCGWVVGW